MNKKFYVTVPNVPLEPGFVKGALMAVAKYHSGVVRRLSRDGDLQVITFRFKNKNDAGNFATVLVNIPLMQELTAVVSEVGE